MALQSCYWNARHLDCADEAVWHTGSPFSWNRLSGLSAAKGKLSGWLKVLLTRSGRQRKVVTAVESYVFLVLPVIVLIGLVVRR